MTTRTDMINEALLRIGAVPLQDDLDPQAAQHVAIYTGVLERLAAAPFSFFKVVRRLVRLSTAPVPGHFRYQFQLPAGRPGPVRAVYADDACRRPVTDYDIEGDRLLTNHEQVWVQLPELVTPERWPGDFRELFRLALMAQLALSVREDRPLHDRLYQMAFGSPGQSGVGGMYAEVLYNDNQAVPSTALGAVSNPLIDVRR